MCERIPGWDANVATVGQGSRGDLQCADILVADQRSRRSARRWIHTVWLDYPGCVVAVARQHRGRWCVVAVRGQEILVVRAPRGSTVDSAVAESLARAWYAGRVIPVAGGPGRGPRGEGRIS